MKKPVARARLRSGSESDGSALVPPSQLPTWSEIPQRQQCHLVEAVSFSPRGLQRWGILAFLLHESYSWTRRDEEKAMARVDSSGGSFQFSDASNPTQTLLFNQFSQPWLAQRLARRFTGATVAVSEIAEYVLVHTSGIAFKGSLRILERDGKVHAVNPPPDRRRGNFKDESMKIKFEGAR
jgi:hypothetical protein